MPRKLSFRATSFYFKRIIAPFFWCRAYFSNTMSYLNRSLILWLTLFSISVRAQTNTCQFSISGKIVESGTGSPIPDAMVMIKELQVGDYTNEQGAFKLQPICPGNYTLVIRHLNHEEKTESIVVQQTIKSKVIYMACHTDSLHEIKVKGAKLHWEDVGVSNKIQGEDLFLSSGQSLGKSLEKVNGVYNLCTGNNINKPVIRGMHSNRVLIMNNELRQEGQQWGNEHAPEIDQYMAKEIEVVKGAQTIRYGSDIIGGLILVNPKSMKLIEHNAGEVNLSGFSNGRSIGASALLEGRLKQWNSLTWRIQGTYKRAGNARTPDYFLKNTGMKEINYSAALGYQKKNWDLEVFHSYFNTDIGIFAGSHIGNLTDLYNAFERDRPIDSAGFTYRINLPYQHVVHQLSKAKLNYKLGNWGTLHLLYGFQRNTRKEFDKTLQAKQDDGTYKPALNFELNTHNFDVTFEHKTIHRFEGSVGINGFYQTNNYYGSYFIPNYQKLTGGLYWVEKWHKHALSIEGGLRYDINQFEIQKWENNMLLNASHAYNGFAATLAARYQFPLFTIHLNGGTAWRAPFVNEMYSFGVHHSAASFEIGDRMLIPERNYNTSMTIDFSYKKKTDLELTLFSNFINNYINLQPQMPATLTIRGAFPTYRYSQVDAHFYGAEFSASTLVYKNIRLNNRANWTLARNLTQESFLVGIPPLRIESDLEMPLFNHKQNTVSGKLGASYTFKQNRVADSSDYVPAPEGYVLVQADVLANWHVAKHPIQINVGGTNLINTRYRDFMNRNRYFVNELGRNIYIRLKIPFDVGKHQHKTIS
jgi:iron complex outermembrane receptor protein